MHGQREAEVEEMQSEVLEMVDMRLGCCDSKEILKLLLLVEKGSFGHGFDAGNKAEEQELHRIVSIHE